MDIKPWHFSCGLTRQHPYAFVVAMARVGRQSWVATNGRFIHAEDAVLRRIPKNVHGHRIHLYVWRISTPTPRKKPVLTMARPCIHCQALLWRRGVKARNVWYADWQGQFRRMNAK